MAGRGDGARYRPGEGVPGEVELLKPPQRRERAVGDLPGEPVLEQEEEPERGERGHVRERAREAVVAEAERAQRLERREQTEVRRRALQLEALQLQDQHSAIDAVLHPRPLRRVADAGRGRAPGRPLVQLPRRAAVRPPQRRPELVQHVRLRLVLSRHGDGARRDHERRG